MKFGVVYKLTIGTNFIVGSTLRPYRRKAFYISRLRTNRYNNTYVQDSYNKYGEDSLRWEILQENIPEHILECVEDIWMGALGAMAADGKGGMNMKTAFRPIFSEETKQKMRKPKSEEAKRNMSLSKRGKPSIMKGKKHTEESKKKMSESRKGKPSLRIGFKHTEESRLKMSLKAKGRLVSSSTKEKMSFSQINNKVNNRNKITEDVAKQIKNHILQPKSKDKLKRREFCNLLGISEYIYKDVQRGKTWKHVN